MKIFTIQIKNMVCFRCIHVVKQILTDLRIEYSEVNLGYVVLLTEQIIDFDVFNQRLEMLDLGLVKDQNEVIVTKINKAVHDYLEEINFPGHKLKLSQYIALQLGRNYHQLSKIYSQYKGKTIEQYFIELRTNKVKELVKQGKLNLSQIAINVGYSSIHYLSAQFKKYTGKSLSQFKKEWEAYLNNPHNIISDDKNLEIQNTGYGCRCEDCKCKGNQASLGENKSSIKGKTSSSLTISEGDNTFLKRNQPFFDKNIGEYKFHLPI